MRQTVRLSQFATLAWALAACASDGPKQSGAHTSADMRADASATEDAPHDAGADAASAPPSDDSAMQGDTAAMSGSATGDSAKSGSDDSVTDTSGLYRCPDLGGATFDSTLSGAYREDQHWQGIVAVSGMVTVDAASVTIEPGTVLVMQAGASLRLGGANDESTVTLNARASADHPIRVCGAQSMKGFWDGVHVLWGVTADSTLDYWLVDGAGGDGEAAFEIEGKASISHLQVRHASGDGIEAGEFGAGSSANLVDSVDGYPVRFVAANGCSNFPSDTQFQNSAQSFAAVAFEPSSDAVALVFHKLALPYLQVSDVAIGIGSCTFEAGVDYRFAQGVGLELGKTGAITVQVQGSDKQPVALHGAQAQKGFWRGLLIDATAKADSALAQLAISDAGSSGAYALALDAAVKLDHVTLSNNANGAQFAQTPSADSKELSFHDNDGYPITVPAEAMLGLPSSLHVAHNARDMVEVPRRMNGPALVGTLHKLGVPYHFEGLALSDPGDAVAIEAGSELVFAAGSGLEIGKYNSAGKLSALGSPDHPIWFHGDGATSGAWTGIAVDMTASSDTQFQYVKVSGAGLQLHRAVTVRNSQVNDSPSYGITKNLNDTSDYTSTNTFSNDAEGDVGNF